MRYRRRRLSDRIDLIYNRLIAEERLKNGTKYERLAAIAFGALTGETTIHDLRLRGETGVAHQIDVTLGDQDQPRQRILIEAKDYDRPVGLGIVHDFWAVVDDLKPTAAWVVTSKHFTRDAMRYAKAKGILLAVLRPPEGEEDWKNIVQTIHLTYNVTAMHGTPIVTWELHRDDPFYALDDVALPGGSFTTADLELVDQAGVARPFQPELDAELAKGAVELGGEGERTGIVRFSEPTWLRGVADRDLRMVAYGWRAQWGTSTFEQVIKAGRELATLVLRSIDGSVHKMMTDRDIVAWTFGEDGRLIPRGTSGEYDG